MGDWFEPVVLAASLFLFLVLMIAFLRRASRRRKEMYEEGPVPRLREEGEESVEAPIDPGDLRQEPEAELETKAEPELEPEAGLEPKPEPKPEPEPEVEVEVDQTLREGLTKTREGLWGKISSLFKSGTKVEAKLLDELEEALLVADVGVRLTMRLIDELRDEVAAGKIESGEEVRAKLRQSMQEAMAKARRRSDPLAAASGRPRVIMFVGVNGVGKTTTIGKVAQKLKDAGQDVRLAAADTFRAAAVEQLAIWGERTGCEVLKGEKNADPGSVVFKAIKACGETGADVLLADTAGRLHTKSDLMDEICKVKRAAGKAQEGAPDDVWLVVDATTGQNALRQAEEFHAALGVTGVILTKLDGTAKGGVVIAIADALALPVLFVGVGEKASDLRPFDPEGFTAALFA